VVTTPAGDAADVLRQVAPACIVTRDVHDIAEALENTCHLGVRSNGREHVTKYATETIARLSVEFYRDVAAGYRRNGRAPLASRG
jgi:predicted subunit of tRNA(5-methylaminomethyl-2-thiouridylate) methyltransferase